jgi:hypothetical protein
MEVLMVARLLISFLAALVVILLTSCVPGSPALSTPTSTTEPVDWQRSFDEMAALASGLETPEYLLQENPVRTGQEFDPNAYFEVLDRLAMEPGYVLDYVYWYDEMAGRPVLYARELDAPPFQNFAEYERARDEPPDAFLDHVQADGSPESFFQLVVLRMLGDRFYLWWHAMMDDDSILTDQESLEKILENAESFCSVPTDPILAQSATLDLEPKIETADEQINVELLVFSQFGGLLRKTYSFSRSFPHTLLGETEDTLVPYQCGVVP